MKYRLPGVYLGNISLDLFMQYMTNEDLSNQITSNDYFKTDARTENIQIFKVIFSFNSENYVLYTYNIRDIEAVREVVRTYFSDIIKNDSDPLFDYNDTVDSMVFTVQDTTDYTNPVLYDTLVEPSIYGPYMINSDGITQYMISIEGSSGENLNTYSAMKQYIEDPLKNNPAQIDIYDIRYQTKVLIKTLYADITSLKEDSINLMEYILDINDDITAVNENKLYFGIKTLLNLIDNGIFYFKDKFGGKTTSSYRNVVMQDIENNRSILDESIQLKMLKNEYSSIFKGRAGMIRNQMDNDSKVNILFSKYDLYDIKKKFELISVLPESDDIRFEDMEPNMIDLIDSSINDTYEYNHDRLVIYTDLLNTELLPKFKAMHTYIDNEHRYYIFDTIRGEVPEYVSTGTSDAKTLCLLDVYTKNSIQVKTRGTSASYPIVYNISPDGNNIFRTITTGGKTYYIKLADNENGLTSYIMFSSNLNKEYLDSESLLSDFPFSSIGITLTKDNIYPISYKSDGAGGSIVDEWGIDILMDDNEKVSLELKDGDGIEVSSFRTFMDTSTLAGKGYFKIPIRLDISNSPTELIEDVLVTMRAKRLVSSNDYEFETSGYWATNTSLDYSIEPPILSEYNTTETKPYNNISSYLTINNFDETYSKTYYVVNKYDQSKMYEVTETVIHSPAPDNPSPYNNTFLNITNSVRSNILLNTINLLVERFGRSVTVDDRGRLISSDIMGADLIEGLKNEFKRGFNNIFYGITNYTYNYKINTLSEIDKLDFLRNSLVGYDSLNKLLNSFLKYNYISKNNYLYTIDNNFRFGFFVKKDTNSILRDNKIFTDWTADVPIGEIDSNKLNSLQKIKEYEKTASDSDISNKLQTDWIKNNKLRSNDRNTTTGYNINKINPSPVLKDINNNDMFAQAIDMLMDQRYNVTKVIDSFTKTNITKLNILDDKEKDLYTNTHEQVRFINSNQNIDVMIKSYLGGFRRKVGE